MGVNKSALLKIEIPARALFFKPDPLKKSRRGIAVKCFAPNAVKAEVLEAMIKQRLERLFAEPIALPLGSNVDRKLRASRDQVNRSQATDADDIAPVMDLIHPGCGIGVNSGNPARLPRLSD